MERPVDRQGRKAAIAAYKERKPAWGVFAVRCAATGQVWVGGSRHVDTQRNGLWFSLRHGASPYRVLQSAWGAQGEAAFAFEVLERLPDDDGSDIGRADALARMCRRWQAALDALPL
jgi:hypothetical protein